MPLDKISDIDIKFSAPDEKLKELERAAQSLKKIPGEYKDVFYPSIKKKLGKLFSSKEKQKAINLKQALKEKLTDINNTVAQIYSECYEDKSARKRSQEILRTINAYCKKANITVALKASPPANVTWVKRLLRDIKEVAEKMQVNLQKLNEKNKTIKTNMALQQSLKQIEKDLPDFDKNIKEAEKLGINIEEYKKSNAEWNKTKGEIELAQSENEGPVTKALKEYEEYSKRYDELIDELKKEKQDWKKLEVDFKKFLDNLIKLSKTLKALVASPEEKVTEQSGVIEKISKELAEKSKELDGKIKFAEKMKDYWVFDSNMGIVLDNSLKNVDELRKIAEEKATKEEDYKIKNAAQNCWSIAHDNEDVKQQYDHSKDWTASGAYYILVDAKTKKQVKEQYDNGFGNSGTLNESGKEGEACKEVKVYLQKALQAGTFDKNKF